MKSISKERPVGLKQKQSLKYTVLLMAFPFLVLFSPRIPLIFTHARLDELLLITFLPFAFEHYMQSSFGFAKKYNSSFFLAFLILFAVFVSGLLYGGDEYRWSQPNLIQVTRPIFVIFNILVLRYWIYKSHANNVYLAVGLVSAVTLAGAVGYYAMFNPSFSNTLTKIYFQEIVYYNASLFDMSKRAMSVFTGYDQASITYAIGCMLTIYIFFNSRSHFLKGYSAIMSACLIIAIVSSARIGFVSLFCGLLMLVALYTKGRIHVLASMFIVFFAVLFLFYPLVSFIFPNNETIEHFKDVFELFNFRSPLPFWERSVGVSAALETQIYAVSYPHGSEMIFGFGDDGKFISDIGYVIVFVKYGIIGLAILFSFFIIIGNRGFRINRKIESLVSEKKAKFPINAILPGLMTLFIIASMKGGLYFITYKIGELFAFILALCVIECEMAFASKEFRNGKQSSHKITVGISSVKRNRIV